MNGKKIMRVRVPRQPRLDLGLVKKVQRENVVSLLTVPATAAITRLPTGSKRLPLVRKQRCNLRGRR